MPVDDIAVVQKIVQAEIVLLKKIISVWSTPSYDVQSAQVPVSLDFLKKLPKLVAVKFSPIAHLLQEDTSDQVVTFLLSLLNNPEQWIPPFPSKAKNYNGVGNIVNGRTVLVFGVVVQGQHIFTFDGKHLTFPGNCKYLLARDAVNGNFTIVGTYTNGLLSAITLADNQDSITLKKGGQVFLNNGKQIDNVRFPKK